MGETGPRALSIHRYLFRLALAAGNIFGWIIVFRTLYFFSADISVGLAGTAILYVLQQGVIFLLTPLAGAALRHGIRRALIVGSLSAALSFAFLAELFASRFAIYPDVAFSLVAGFAIMGGIQRALYFVPYASAHALTHARRGHEFLREVSLALMPLIGGYVIAGFAGGVGLLFASAAALALAACVSLVELPEMHEKFEWRYSETMRALLSRMNRRDLWISVTDGIQGATLLLVWPLAVFVIIGQSFFAFGVIMAATFVVAFLMRRIVHGILERLRVKDSPYVLASIAVSSWVFRLAVGTPIQIIVADVYYHTGADPRRRGIDAHSFDQGADNGHYMDEYTALKEMGFSVGRIVLCVLFALLALLASPTIAFVACIVSTAIAAGASVILSRNLSKQIV